MLVYDLPFVGEEHQKRRTMINKDKNKLKAVRELENGYFIEVNRGSDYIQKFCQHAIETIELTAEDWKVFT